MLRCDCCGRFISERDFDNGATRKLIQQDSDFGGEDWKTICITCNKEEANAA